MAQEVGQFKQDVKVELPAKRWGTADKQEELDKEIAKFEEY